MVKKNIVGLAKHELVSKILSIGKKSILAKKIWGGIYNKGAKNFFEIPDIPKSLQSELDALYTIERPIVKSKQISEDGTIKWLLTLSDGHEIETVYIPEKDRGSLCLSSQIGCTLSCTFCYTGTQNLVRNLTSSEIISQLLIARDEIGEWPSTREPRLISNIVMMGMGEPLLNYNNVSKALKIIMDNEGISISRKKITLSTSGIVPNIKRCGQELGVNLAISLHATNDKLRSQLIPINKKYDIESLLAACKAYPASNNSNRITFEYVMLDGVNDSAEDAHKLVMLLMGIHAKVNIILFNPWPKSSYKPSSDQMVRAFIKIINKAGYSAPIREARGEDILAACGQLKSKSKREKVSL